MDEDINDISAGSGNIVCARWIKFIPKIKGKTKTIHNTKGVFFFDKRLSFPIYINPIIFQRRTC